MSVNKVSAIDGAKLEFVWDTRSIPSAKITGAVRHWDVGFIVYDTDKTTTTDADGKETGAQIPISCISIHIHFEGIKYGEAHINTPAATWKEWEAVVRQSPAVIEEALTMARNNLQGHVNRAMWKLGVTPQPQ